MAKVRSPNYPNISLGPAIDAVRPAYEKDHRNKMSREVLAKHMGYTSLNGRALGKIGAVRSYGLIDGSGDELRISDDAVTALMAPAGSPDRVDVLARLAHKPPLFQEILKDFPTTMPSLDNLKFSLIKRQFTPDAAEKAAKSYLATMNLVAGIPDSYNGSDEEEEEESEVMQPLKNQQPKRLRDLVEPPAPPPSVPTQPGMLQEVFNLEEGPVTLVFPATLSEDSYQDLSDRLEIVLRGLKRRANAARQAQGAAQIPFMITNAQKQQLRELGYTDEAIRNMTPQGSLDVLTAGIKPPPY